MPDFPPKSENLHTESDVEQKFLFPFLTLPSPIGLGTSESYIFTKADIRKFKIGKGTSEKLYYPDYIIVLMGLPLLIVEAKAPSEKSLDDAAREARLYATELNSTFAPGINPCRFCLVSNGLQTDLRHSDSDKLIHSITLNNCHAGSSAFAELIEAIGLATLQRLAVEIASQFRPERFQRPLNNIGGTSRRDERVEFNGFGKLLTSRFQNLFNPSSWEDRRRIVRDAYVPSRRKERYIDEIDSIIRASRPPQVAEAQLIEDTSSPREITLRLAHPNELKNRILLLIGAVGAGKSTFVDYLQEVAVSEEEKKNLAWVRLDLNEAPVSQGEIYDWCREKLLEGIRATSPDLETSSPEAVRKLYRSQVREFDALEGALLDNDSPEYKRRFLDLITHLKADKKATLKALEIYLCTGRGRLLIVGLDNCDKRNRDEQLLMFQVAKWIQQEVRCLVIVPLRQETFENHRNEPPLDTALKDLIYRIEAPPFQEVLSKRLDLVLATAKSDANLEQLSYRIGGGAKIVVSYDKIERYMKLMMGSLFQHKNYGRKIIIGLAGWDIRRAFEIFLDFCRSGYVDDRDIFGAQATGDHEFLNPGIIARVLLRTNRRFYDGDFSYVKNLFQSDPTSTIPDCFLRYHILSWLRHRRKENGPSGIRGFHRTGDLVKSLVAHGSDGEMVLRECAYLLRAKCMLSEHLRTDTLSTDDLIAITPAGHVHLDLAHGDPNYLAACAEDCWIADPALVADMERRIVIEPFWKALARPITLDSACDFANYLIEYRRRVLSPDPSFLTTDDAKYWDLDLNQVFQTLKNERDEDRLRYQKNHRNYC